MKTGNDVGTRFEYECYDISHLYNLAHFVDSSLAKKPLFIQSVFGFLGGIGPHPEDLMHMKRTADPLFDCDYQWSILGVGRSQMSLASIGAAQGVNVRGGLEDSLLIEPSVLARSNEDQIVKIRKILAGLSLKIATPEETRKLLDLKGDYNVNF